MTTVPRRSEKSVAIDGEGLTGDPGFADDSHMSIVKDDVVHELHCKAVAFVFATTVAAEGAGPSAGKRFVRLAGRSNPMRRHRSLNYLTPDEFEAYDH